MSPSHHFRLATALLVLGAMPPTLHAQLAITGLERVAGGAGVRDRPSVTVGPNGYVVFWEESPFLTSATSPGRNPRILRQDLAFDGTLLGTPTVAMGAWAHQWGATAAMSGDRSWLAYYFADRSMRTGDRDLGLDSYDGVFDRSAITARLTQDPPGGSPLTHASPALLYDRDNHTLIVTSSIGAYRGEPRIDRRSYDSVNIEIRVLDSTGALQSRLLVKGPDEIGEAATPALAILPEHWRERYVLAYVSNAGHRDDDANGYSLWFELYNRDWRVVGGRHFSLPTGGASRPSLATVGDKLFVAWVDNATNDIRVSELDQTLHPMWVMSLRDALGETGFSDQFGAGAPGLSAPNLYQDFGTLGLAFVATWEWDATTGHARQEVFLGKVGYR